jgi:hypothetical protein
MTVQKIVCTWSGFTGSPGYTTFYWSAAQASLMQPGVVTFFDGVKQYLATALQVSIPNNGTEIDEASGKTTGVWTAGSTTAITGTAAGAWAGPSGAVVRWETGRFLRGKRVRGRTFLVPLTSSVYSSGTLSTTVANAINLAADGLRGKGALQVWSRPIHLSDGSVGTDGQAFPVTANTCPTKVAVLTQRRD